MSPPPRIGMNLYLWLTRLSPEHFGLLGELREAGFDGVEIPTGDYTPAEQGAIRRALAEHGLACTVATLLTPEHDPIADDPGIRRAAREKLRRDIEVADGLGAEVLVGPMHSGHKRFTGRGPTREELERCVGFLGDAGQEAANASLRLAVEPLNRFECYFLNTAEQALALVEAVDHPAVGVLYDTHHAHIEERDAADAIASLGSRLSHFHVSESHRGTPGTGSVDWAGSFRALREAGFAGWLVIEAFGTGVPGIPEAVNVWRDCFADEGEVYREGLALIRRHLAEPRRP